MKQVAARDPTPIQVLLLEDSPIDRRLLSADFRKLGHGEFDLIPVAGLDEAISLLGKSPIDVILLDLFLRETTGLETLSRVRSISPDLPIVVLTLSNDTEQALSALRNGAQDYLVKGTVDGPLLFRAIRYAIERKQAENERRLLEQRLLEMQKLEAIGTLASGVAHNFNNALTVVLGHCTLLLENTREDSTAKHALSIQVAAQRAAKLTRQLLAFSSQQSPEPTLASLNRIILEVQTLVESVLRNQVELEIKLAPNLGLLMVDPAQIKRIIMNLVINAHNAMPNGGRITIETGSGSQRDVGAPPFAGSNVEELILLTITDTGSGMSAETCARVFEPFFTTKALAAATGLGLSTVYGIVKQQGGTIVVQSELGKGTTFSIAFQESRRSTTARPSPQDRHARQKAES